MTTQWALVHGLLIQIREVQKVRKLRAIHFTRKGAYRSLLIYSMGLIVYEDMLPKYGAYSDEHLTIQLQQLFKELDFALDKIDFEINCKSSVRKAHM